MAPSVPATNTHQDGDTDAHAKVDIGDISPKQYPEAMRVRRFDPLPARRAGVLLASALLALVVVVPLAFATQPAAADTSSASSFSRISVLDPLNGGFLVVNMHGMLFHPDTSDVAADLAYARWLGGGIIRVFATDSNGLHRWNGTQVGARIAEIAPMLRAAHLRLIVAFVNNHQAVPGEATASAGWMDNYMQLLLPFYTDTWHGAYRQFVRDLVTTVEWYQTQDVIYAWELGNELHTPAQPNALISFVTEASTQVRALDPVTPILPGTMGANHVEPGNRQSSIARWLYCDAPVDAYTLHAYDWVSRQRPGDMPIDWDLDNIVSKPCPNGRTLPVIVEELGTSRALAGVYTADDERARLEQERRQIAFVRQFPSVVGFGVWNGESPELNDRTFVDIRRGLTSYGTTGPGGGSCFDPHPDAAPGARCQLEQMLRGVHFLRVAESSDWVADADASTTASDPLVGSVDPVYSEVGADVTALKISGWVLDPLASASPGIDSLDLFVGPDNVTGTRVGAAALGLSRTDLPTAFASPDWSPAGFSITLPLASVPLGPTQLTLAAHTPDHGVWLSRLTVVIPSPGPTPLVVPTATPSSSPPPTPAPRLQAEVESPQPHDQITRTFTVQVLAPNADRVDVFLEPDRDKGGVQAGSASSPFVQSADHSVKVTANAPIGAHTLYVHVTGAGHELVFVLPVVVKN